MGFGYGRAVGDDVPRKEIYPMDKLRKQCTELANKAGDAKIGEMLASILGDEEALDKLLGEIRECDDKGKLVNFALKFKTVKAKTLKYATRTPGKGKK